MIPKIIHYVWFGGEKPETVKRQIESWRIVCPEYEIIEWNEKNCEEFNCDFLQESLAVKKYAFASDVIRMAVLLKYGGIYLDTDVCLLKSFNNFLHCTSFIGLETPFEVSTAVIGSCPGVLWVEDFLLKNYMTKGIHFISKDGNLDMEPNTRKLSCFFNNTWHKYSKDVTIYPVDYFCCKSYFTGIISTTENSVAIHNFLKSWQPGGRTTILDRLKNCIIRIRQRLRCGIFVV